VHSPAGPLRCARPSGNAGGLELRSTRAVSSALPARTPTLAGTCRSDPVLLSTYATPEARPGLSTVTSRAIALVTSVRRPVVKAGAISTLVEVKFAFTRQPRLHWPQ